MFEEIGRYKILEQLGQGAMATVYKAYDPKIDRALAIKVLRQERCSDAEYRMRFLREAKAAGILSHPNIVTVYDVGELEGRPYIVMELLEGTPLDHVMKSGERMPMDRVVSIGLQLAQALSFAHAKGIVHRDVKPSNIVISGDAIKVTDFGIARMETKDSTRQTQMGEILGTPQYMSPEQVIGKDVDARSDLFSVGVLLYQLLAGETPFEADTLTTLLFKIATEEPKPLQAPSNLPASLKRIVDRLLKKQPEKRFQTAAELADALARVKHELQEAAEQKDLPRVIPIRVRWALIMGGLVAVTMILSIFFIYGKQYRAMQDQVIDYGSSLVKFMAAENAVPMLSEDWASLDLFVQDTMDRQDFRYLTVLDHRGVVRGSSDATQVGKTYTAIQGAEPVSRSPDVQVVSHTPGGGEKVLDFDAPILFQKKEVGRVHLGIRQAPLQRVANLSIYLMLILMGITVASVTVITYVMGNFLARPIKALTVALQDLAEGHYDVRIGQRRTDEFGRLFRAFDKAAEALHKRHSDAAPENPV
ncbi:MAG: protein kinase [Deltaproteobacteria bacterium]|nr:protein kinase [Deltaproteobacteria bacterium]